jgi:hypothetical protein
MGHGSIADEVAGEEDHVRSEEIDVAHHFAEEKGLGVFGEMEVGDLNDAQAMEGFREPGETDGERFEAQLVAGDFAGVEGHASDGGSGKGEEGAAIEGSGRFRRMAAGWLIRRRVEAGIFGEFGERMAGH